MILLSETPFQRASQVDFVLIFLGVALAILLSAQPIFVIAYGLADINGSPAFTGCLLFFSQAVLLSFSFRSGARLTLLDLLLCGFLICIVTSFALNGNTAPLKEYALLILSVFSYVCCRFLRRAQFERIVYVFLWVTIPIVAIGTIATGFTLVGQWNDPHGKPFVFGFDAAPTHFVVLLSLDVIAIVSVPLQLRKSVTLSALLFVPVVILAASMVRYAFIALLGSLFIAAILSDRKQKRGIAIIAVTIIAGVATGLYARSNTTDVFMSYALEETKSRSDRLPQGSPSLPMADNMNVFRGYTRDRLPEASPLLPKEDYIAPSCQLDVDKFNSIALRKALLMDAFSFVRQSGPFGLGLGGFMTLSCVPGLEVHNSFLQAAIEFGWFGGLALVGLVAIASLSLLGSAFTDQVSRLKLCWLSYVVAISLVSGRISQDLLLFSMLGLAAASVSSATA